MIENSPPCARRRLRLPTILLIAAIATPLFAEASERAAGRRLDPGRAGARIEAREDGRISSASDLAIRFAGDPAESARQALSIYGDLLKDPADGTTLEVRRVRESLTGTFVEVAHFVEGERVLGSGAILRFDATGALQTIENQVAVRNRGRAVARSSMMVAEPVEVAGRRILRREAVLIEHEGEVRRAVRLIADDPPFGEIVFDVDASSGELLQTIPLYWLAPARVFESNPVTSGNDPSLQDQDDSPLAVPESAYTMVELRDLSGAGLSGPRVIVTDLELPKTAQPDAGASLHFDRGHDSFEEVMAYHHLDSAIRYLEDLGYRGSRRIFSAPLRVDAHAVNGVDQSFYRLGSTGEGRLFFGDGGVDDAEDPDILIHELGHAIQDGIALFAFSGSFGSQARALGEGFGDYWAFSYGFDASMTSGRDPFCIGDWDARCGDAPSSSCGYPAGADCLRRVDSSKTMADYLIREQSGVEHKNGEIWSSALREIFLSAVSREGVERGRRMIDTVVIESHFGIPPRPTFRTLARRMLDADRALYSGVNRAAICGSMIGRGILTASDCELVPRGGYTVHQSPDFPRSIPDNDPAGVKSTLHVASDRQVGEIRVHVGIRHPFRGELRIHLTGPNGRTVILQAPNADSGADIDTVFGLEAEPFESLDAFRGIAARGEWTLHVIDTRAVDEGELLSWSLDIRFEGDAPAVERPSRGGSILIPAVAHAPGAAGTFFVSDARIVNRGTSEAKVSAIFTASGADGMQQFASFDLAIAAGQQVVLDDLVESRFRTDGVGALELRGDVADLVVTSRTYNDSALGTFGQFIPPVDAGATAAAGEEAIHVVDLRNDAAFRSNLGFVDLSGTGGVIAWDVFDASGLPIEEGSLTLPPHGHAQVAVLGGVGGLNQLLARAEVRVTEGGARVAAYGSIVDNRTGDAVFVPAERARTSGSGTVPAVIRGDGAEGTRWRSDLWISNLSAEAESFDLQWHDAAGEVRTSAVVLGAASSIRIEDVLASRWGAASGSGLLRILSTSGSWAASSRAWTPGGGGTYGQWIPAVDAAASTASGEPPLVVPQLARSSAFRTNLGVAEIAGAGTTLRLSLRDAGGRELWSSIEQLRPFEQRQVSLAAAGAPEFPNGYAWIEVIEGGGRIVGYGSVIDNRSGDPIYVPALP